MHHTATSRPPEPRQSSTPKQRSGIQVEMFAERVHYLPGMLAMQPCNHTRPGGARNLVQLAITLLSNMQNALFNITDELRFCVAKARILASHVTTV